MLDDIFQALPSDELHGPNPFSLRSFVADVDYAFAAALLRSHIFLFEAMIAFSPAALSLRFAFGACAGAGTVFFTAAPVAFAALAALAFFRFATSAAFAAAESFRFGLGTSTGVGAAGCARYGSQLALMAAIRRGRPPSYAYRLNPVSFLNASRQLFQGVTTTACGRATRLPTHSNSNPRPGPENSVPGC